MQFSEDEQRIIRDWIGKHTSGGIRCFICGLHQWTVLPSAAMTITADTQTGRIHYMEGYPLVGLTCNNCAHIIWLSAAAMGLRPKSAEAAGGKDQPAG